MALTVFLAHVRYALFQEGPHKGLSPLASQLLLRDIAVVFTVLLPTDTRALMPWSREPLFADPSVYSLRLTHLFCQMFTTHNCRDEKRNTPMLIVTVPRTAARSHTDFLPCFTEVPLLSIQNCNSVLL